VWFQKIFHTHLKKVFLKIIPMGEESQKPKFKRKVFIKTGISTGMGEERF